ERTDAIFNRTFSFEIDTEEASRFSSEVKTKSSQGAGAAPPPGFWIRAAQRTSRRHGSRSVLAPCLLGNPADDHRPGDGGTGDGLASCEADDPDLRSQRRTGKERGGKMAPGRRNPRGR